MFHYETPLNYWGVTTGNSHGNAPGAAQGWQTRRQRHIRLGRLPRQPQTGHDVYVQEVSDTNVEGLPGFCGWLGGILWLMGLISWLYKS